MVPVTSRDTWIKQGSNPCFHMMWIRRVIRVALARHCKVEESMRTAAAVTGAVPGEGRRERGREGEQFWLQEERKALCRRFSVARAVRSIGLPQLHAAATMARGEGEETAKEREREGEGISHLRTSKLFHRPLVVVVVVAVSSRRHARPSLSMALGHKSRRIGHYRSRLLWRKLGIARKQQRQRAAKKTGKFH